MFFEIPEFFLEKMHEYAVLTHNNFYMLAKNQKSDKETEKH